MIPPSIPPFLPPSPVLSPSSLWKGSRVVFAFDQSTRRRLRCRLPVFGCRRHSRTTRLCCYDYSRLVCLCCRKALICCTPLLQKTRMCSTPLLQRTFMCCMPVFQKTLTCSMPVLMQLRNSGDVCGRGLRAGAVSEYNFNQHTQLAVLIVCVEL